MYIVCLAARVIENITTGYDSGNLVVGVTSVDDELFVLLYQDVHQVAVHQVAVYSINDYRRLRHITVPEYRPIYCSDISSTSYWLYMSDPDNTCIYRYDLASSATSKRPVRGRPAVCR